MAPPPCTGGQLLGSAERAEGGAELGREQLGLFPGGEVTAPLGLVEVGESGVGLLDPTAGCAENLAGERAEADRDLHVRQGLAGGPGVLPVGPGGRGAGADRKSTRLNSSHPSISYAVFCLKKKKKK